MDPQGIYLKNLQKRWVLVVISGRAAGWLGLRIGVQGLELGFGKHLRLLRLEFWFHGLRPVFTICLVRNLGFDGLRVGFRI